MNVFLKLQEARTILQNMNLKKSGKNTFSNYDFFTLEDFLPNINQIFFDLKLASFVSFTSELATLTIINSEKPEEKIEFTSPMAEANLKGCHPIQNLGAVQSYQRRYLYMNALEIVESDTLDATTGQESTKTSTSQQAKTPLSEKQLKMIEGKLASISSKLGMNKTELIGKMNLKEPATLSSSEAAQIIKKLIDWENKNS